MADLFSHPSDGVHGGFDQSGWVGQGRGARAICIVSEETETMGIHRVKVKLNRDGVLFGQRRNLTKPYALKGTHEFLSLLTEYIPSMSSEVHTDRRLFASACGAQIEFIGAEKTNARSVFIAGDSTVADQYASAEYYPFDSFAGWGQMLSCFLDQAAVCNMAHSGMTARCFAEDGHFGIVQKYIKADDLLLIQFGHNDQKRRELQPHRLYTKYLGDIVDAALKKGAQPVLLSPVSRVPGRDAAGTFDLLQLHAEAVHALAQRRKLPFIDLHSYTFEKYCAMGESCRDLFKDMTHSNDPGAFAIARFVAQELKRMGIAETSDAAAGFIESDRQKNPCRPVPSMLPVSYLDIGEIPDRQIVREGVRCGLLDPCVLHMHPFEPLSRAEFIQKLFRAAGLKGKATDGIAPYRDVNGREFDASYAAACKSSGLVEGEYYRPDDMISAAEVNEFMHRLGCQARLSGSKALPNRYELIKLLLAVKAERAS